MVIWSDTAKSDLRAIHDFIAHDSKYYAKMLTQDIAAKAEVLADLRLMGRVVPELSDEARVLRPGFHQRLSDGQDYRRRDQGHSLADADGS